MADTFERIEWIQVLSLPNSNPRIGMIEGAIWLQHLRQYKGLKVKSHYTDTGWQSDFIGRKGLTISYEVILFHDRRQYQLKPSTQNK